jgi:rhodanese-related sulfurtransferase
MFGNRGTAWPAVFRNIDNETVARTDGGPAKVPLKIMQMTPKAAVTEPGSAGLRPGEVLARIARGQPLQIIDVREFPEFAAGHIASARLVPLSELGTRSGELDRNTPIICVCRSGKRSAQAASKLLALDFVDVAQLEGGLLAWQQSGLPVVRDARAPWPLERQVRFALGLFVLSGLALSLRWPAAIIVSWIIGLGMVFTSIIDWCGMALLLAKAPWNKQRGPSCGK